MNLDHPASPQLKILVVDDHPNTASLLARAISRLGSCVNVISATSGREALECVRDGAAHIVITDMDMPGMTGLELIENLQQDPAGGPALSFLLTASHVSGLKIEARRLNITEVLRKPIQPQKVCDIVSQALDELHQSLSQLELGIQKKRFKILIADDELYDLTLLTRFLEGEGYAYVTARDGLETLEQVKNELPDLILLDINMPSKDGFDVLMEIRANPATKDIPIILLSASWLNTVEMPDDVYLGPDDFVTKPLDRSELFTRIRKKLRVKEGEVVVRRRHPGLSLLPEISRDLSAQHTIEELLITLLKHSVPSVGATFGSGMLTNGSGKYQKTYQVGISAACPSSEGKDAFSSRLFEIVHKTRRGFIVDDTSKDRRWAAADFLSRSALIVPVWGYHELQGILILVHEQKNYFNVEHQLLLQAIVSQATLALENIQLKENERIIDEVIASASHDLRTPITSIAGFSYLIKQAGPLNETQNNFLERIQHVAADMNELVENMMSQTKFDLGRVTRADEVDVMHLLWEVAGEIGFHAEIKRQLLSMEKIELDTKVLGDALQLRQALRNLIGNAVKYTPDGGAIMLSIEHESNTATIKVKDTGYGIPASDLPHIFDRFYRVRNNGHDHVEGNGLGLAIVKSIAQGHGGDVTVESEVGKGSCFTLKLPLVQTENSSANSHTTEMKTCS